MQYWTELTNLDCSFRKIMRVPQFGGDIEPEVLGVLNGAVSETNTDTSSLFEGLLQEQGLENGIKLFSDVLQQNLHKPPCIQFTHYKHR